MTLYATGARRAEAAQLKVGDIDTSVRYRASPSLSTTAHEVCRVNLHPLQRRQHVPLRQLEIPASNHRSSSEVTVYAGYLNSSVNCADPRMSDRVVQRPRHRSSMLSEVLPAPFKLHKPLPASFKSLYLKRPFARSGRYGVKGQDERQRTAPLTPPRPPREFCALDPAHGS